MLDPANREDKLLPDLLVALGATAALRDEYDPTIDGKVPDLLAEYLAECCAHTRPEPWAAHAAIHHPVFREVMLG